MNKNITGSGGTTGGINYAGYLKAGFGLGEAARGYMDALEKLGYDVLGIDADELLPGRGNAENRILCQSVRGNQRLHPMSIVHINPDLLLTFRNRVGSDFFRERYTIGIWAWETPVFPHKWYDRFELVDEIWVGGSFMARGISMASSVPVIVMPHVVQPVKAEDDREKFNLDSDEFVFLYSFDFHSTFSRKNPLGVVEAFKRAFDPSQPARLVLKSMNGANRPDQMDLLKASADGLRVSFIDRLLDTEDRSVLLASCDAFVSLHRAEGFGLGIAEAMAMGKPVIATGWSGNTDFMNVNNSLPVRFQLAPLEKSDPPYEKGSIWAVPDIDDASEKMRLVFSNRELAKEIGQRAGEYMDRFHSAYAIGNLLESRLELIVSGKQFRLHWQRKPLPSNLSLWCRNKAASALKKACSALLRVTPKRLVRLRQGIERTRERVSDIL